MGGLGDLRPMNVVESERVNFGQSREMRGEFGDPDLPWLTRYCKRILGRRFNSVSNVCGRVIASVDEKGAYAGRNCAMWAFQQTDKPAVVPHVERNFAIEQVRSSASDPCSTDQSTATERLCIVVQMVYDGFNELES